MIPHLIFDLQAPSHYAQVHRNGAPYAVVAVSPAGCASFTAPDSGLYALRDPWGTSDVPEPEIVNPPPKPTERMSIWKRVIRLIARLIAMVS